MDTASGNKVLDSAHRLPTAAFELITPDVARAMLATNTRNRRVRPSRVNAYSRKMAAGLWWITHQGISFGVDGVLYDGQHRLLALIESGVAQWMLVVRGLRPQTRAAIDVGEKRKANDNLYFAEGAEGPKTDNVTAATARVLHRLILDTSARVMGAEELRSVLNAFPGGFGCMHRVFSSTIRMITRAPVLAAVVLAFRSDPDGVERAAVDLRDGAGLKAGDPMLTLRNALLASPTQGGENAPALFKRTLLAIDARLADRTIVKSSLKNTDLRGNKVFERMLKINGIEAPVAEAVSC